MSAGNPGGIPILFVPDRSSVDAYLAELRQGVKVKVGFDTAGSPSGANPVAQAQAAAGIATPQPGVLPGAFAANTPAGGVGSAPSSGFSTQLVSALQGAANAIASAATQLLQAAGHQARAAKALSSAAQGGSAASTPSPAAPTGAVEADGGGSLSANRLRIPRSASGAIGRFGYAAGGIGGIALAVGLESAREAYVENLNYRENLRGVALDGGSGADEARIIRASTESRRRNPLYNAFALGGPGGGFQQQNSEVQKLNTEEFFSTRAIQSAEGTEFQRRILQATRENVARSVRAQEDNPYNRQLREIDSTRAEREHSLNDLFDAEVKKFPVVPGNAQLSFSNGLDRERLRQDREALLARERNTSGDEEGQVLRRQTRDIEFARFAVNSSDSAVRIQSGRTSTSLGQSPATRDILAQIQQISDQTAKDRAEALYSGRGDIVPDINRLGRDRLLGLRTSLTEGAEAVGADPRFRSLSGRGTVNLGVINGQINKALLQAANLSGNLPGQNGASGQPDPNLARVAANTDSLTQIYTMLQNFVQQVGVA